MTNTYSAIERNKKPAGSLNIPENFELGENVTGIAIRFKVVSSGYAAGTTLYFKYVGKLANHGYAGANANNGVEVTVGEWQTLVVSKDVIENYKRLSSYDYYVMYFTIYSTTGNSSAVATILLDDISYVEKIKTPTNLAFNGGVLTWNAVSGATSYNVQVNQYYKSSRYH